MCLERWDRYHPMAMPAIMDKRAAVCALDIPKARTGVDANKLDEKALHTSKDQVGCENHTGTCYACVAARRTRGNLSASIAPQPPRDSTSGQKFVNWSWVDAGHCRNKSVGETIPHGKEMGMP